MTGERHPMKSKLWPKVSLVLNVILVLAIAVASVWKFTDVRNLLGSGGGIPRISGTSPTSTRHATFRRGTVLTW